MADTKPKNETPQTTEEKPGTKPDPKVEELKDKVEETTDEILDTPEEDRDDQWRTDMLSALADLKSEIAELRKQPEGKNPELAALQTQLAEIAETLKTLQIPSEPDQSKVLPNEEKADSPIRETRKAGLSGRTVVKARTVPSRKPARNWL